MGRKFTLRVVLITGAGQVLMEIQDKSPTGLYRGWTRAPAMQAPLPWKEDEAGSLNAYNGRSIEHEHGLDLNCNQLLLGSEHDRARKTFREKDGAFKSCRFGQGNTPSFIRDTTTTMLFNSGEFLFSSIFVYGHYRPLDVSGRRDVCVRRISSV